MASRRHLVDFDPDHFAKQGATASQPALARFRTAYETRLWNGPESPSGPGSSLAQTARVVEQLPQLVCRLRVTTLLDLPCGDFHWMQHVDLGEIEYVGGDVLPELVDANTTAYADSRKRFLRLDITQDPLPRADLVLCRDCFVHLSYRDIGRALRNIRRGGARYLLTTTFVAEPANSDVVTGDWRPLNLQLPPFHLGDPVHLLNEGCTEQGGAFADKALGLWDLHPRDGEARAV